MLVKQISEILNSVFGEVLGDELITEDLGNIVGRGQAITGYTTFSGNFENYAGKIVDKVGKVVFVSRVYETQDLGLWRDSWDYGSVLEKIRVEVGDYEDNAEWTLTKDADSDGQLDYNESITAAVERMFKFYPAKVRARYFNLKTTFRATVSITEKQLRSAFRSASDMARFIGMIEQRINTKMEIAKDQLQRRTLANFMGERIYGGGIKCVDLKAEYAKVNSSGSYDKTFAQALQDGDFMRFLAKRITEDRKLMTAPSDIYSDLDDGFYNFTPESDARLIVLQDVDTALAFNLYGDTYNKEFVTLTGYKTIPFWQAAGKSMSLADRSGLFITTTESHTIARSNIVGVLFDRDAVMICNADPEVRTQYNPDGGFTNFFYNADCSYYNDFDENGIVYVYGTDAESPISGGLTVTLAKGSNAGDSVVTVTGTPSDATGLYGKAADSIPAIVPGTALNTTGWTAITSGTTALTPTAGQIVTVVAYKTDSDSNKIIQTYGTHTAQASEIK